MGASSEPPAGSGSRRGSFHAEVPGSGWAREAGRPRLGLLDQGCGLPGPLAAGSSWACREWLWERSSLSFSAGCTPCSETPVFVSQCLHAPDPCRSPPHQAWRRDPVLSPEHRGAYRKRLSPPLPGRFNHVAHADRLRFRSQLPCVSGS